VVEAVETEVDVIFRLCKMFSIDESPFNPSLHVFFYINNEYDFGFLFRFFFVNFQIIMKFLMVIQQI
jgi:hypothetical protein